MKKSYWAGILIGAFVLATGLIAIRGDADELSERLKSGEPTSGLGPISNELYARECGSCHFAYQPGLLPASSWKSIMAGLSDHFGDNAELAAVDHRHITAYLSENAADWSGSRGSAKIMRSLEGREAPLRITEVPYIRRKHHEIQARLVSLNPKVKTMARCNTCHTRAGQGFYDEDDVSIPNHGRWDD